MSDVVLPEWWGVSTYRSSQLHATVELVRGVWQVRLLSPLTGTVLLDPETALRLVEFGRTSPQARRALHSSLLMDSVEIWRQPEGLLLVWPDNGIGRGNWSGFPIKPEYLWGRLTVSFMTVKEAVPWGFDEDITDFAPEIAGVPTGEMGYVPIWNTQTGEDERSLDPQSVLDAIEWLARIASEFNGSGNLMPTTDDVMSASGTLYLQDDIRAPQPVGDAGYNWAQQWTPGALIP